MSTAVRAFIQKGVKKAGVLRLLGQTPWAVVDQMLISATNFATIILLARGFSQSALGSFTLVYSFLLFVNSIQAGLVTQPHNILGATRRGTDYVRFTTSTALSQLLLACAGALVATMAWGIAHLFRWEAAPLLLALAPAILAWQSQEFVRRVLYTEGRVRAAFATDLISYGGQAMLITVLWWINCLTGPLAMYALAASSTAGAMLGVWQIRQSLMLRVDTSAFRENWNFGKWVAGGEIVGHWLSAQLFVYLAAGMLGAAAAGVLRAVHTIFGPSRILADVLCTVLPIRFSRTLAEGGKVALHRQMKLAYLVAIPLLGGYCLLVALGANPILHFLYHDKYAGCGSVLALYSVAAFISYLTMIVAAALRAKRLTRSVFMSQVYSSIIAFPIGWLMITQLQIQGTAVGMIVSYLAMTLLLLRTYRRAHGLEPVIIPPADNVAEVVVTQRTTGPGQILQRIFEVLDAAGIPYCVLHGYRSYPHSVPSDIDVMMPADVLPHRLAAVLHQNAARTGGRIVQWIHEDTHYFVLAGKNPDGSVCFLQLDVSIDYDLRNRLFYRGHEILQSRRQHNGFWIPSASVEFGCFLVRRIVKGNLDKPHQQALGELYSQDPAGCRQQIIRFWSEYDTHLIEAAAASGDWAPVRRQLHRLRRHLLTGISVRHPLALAGRWLGRQSRRTSRWIRPRQGLSVILLGPDGAGKSSVTRAVRQDLAPAFFATIGRSFPPALLNRDPGGSGLPHDLPPRSPVSSMVRAVLYWWVYHTAGYLVTVRKDLARFKLVIHDRHLVDCMVDPRRYRYSGPRWLLGCIWFLIPKPDMVILLDAPAAAIQARKREVPLEETVRQLGEYHRLISSMPNGRTVDASQPLGRVVADVDALIVRHLADRAAGQLGLQSHLTAPPEVLRASSQFTGLDEDADWLVRPLGRGDQAEVYTIGRTSGCAVWQNHNELVVKLYRSSGTASLRNAREEFDLLQRLHTQFNGRKLHDWTIICIVPLHVSYQPLALIATKAPGQSFNAWLEAGDDELVTLLHAARHGLIEAMEGFWTTQGRIFGDLDFNNILCDPQNRTLSLIDPGIPESIYLCPDAPRRWYPASRDLAYMLFDVATAVKAALGNPHTGLRRRRLVEAILRTYLAKLASPEQRLDLLDEILACTQVHLRRIAVSWSPLGLGRRVVRRSASSYIRRAIAQLGDSISPPPGPNDQDSSSDRTQDPCSPSRPG